MWSSKFIHLGATSTSCQCLRQCLGQKPKKVDTEPTFSVLSCREASKSTWLATWQSEVHCFLMPSCLLISGRNPGVLSPHRRIIGRAFRVVWCPEILVYIIQGTPSYCSLHSKHCMPPLLRLLEPDFSSHIGHYLSLEHTKLKDFEHVSNTQWLKIFKLFLPSAWEIGWRE